MPACEARKYHRMPVYLNKLTANVSEELRQSAPLRRPAFASLTVGSGGHLHRQTVVRRHTWRLWVERARDLHPGPAGRRGVDIVFPSIKDSLVIWRRPAGRRIGKEVEVKP